MAARRGQSEAAALIVLTIALVVAALAVLGPALAALSHQPRPSRLPAVSVAWVEERPLGGGVCLYTALVQCSRPAHLEALWLVDGRRLVETVVCGAQSLVNATAPCGPLEALLLLYRGWVVAQWVGG